MLASGFAGSVIYYRHPWRLPAATYPVLYKYRIVASSGKATALIGKGSRPNLFDKLIYVFRQTMDWLPRP